MGKPITQHPALARLTEKQRLFVLAYLGGSDPGNASQAAREAGYASPQTAGNRTLQIDGVRRALEAMAIPKETHALASREARLMWLLGVMDGEVGEPETNLAGEVVGAVPGKIKDRIAACKLYEQLTGGFIKKVERVDPSSVDKGEVVARLEGALAKLKEEK